MWGTDRLYRRAGGARQVGARCRRGVHCRRRAAVSRRRPVAVTAARRESILAPIPRDEEAAAAGSLRRPPWPPSAGPAGLLPLSRSVRPARRRGGRRGAVAVGWARSGAAAASPLGGGPWRLLLFRVFFWTRVGAVGSRGPSWRKAWSGRGGRGASPKDEGGLPRSRAGPLSAGSSVKFEKRTFSSPVKRGFILKCDSSHQKPALVLKWKRKKKKPSSCFCHKKKTYETCELSKTLPH